jgi:hypothetical protein
MIHKTCRYCNTPHVMSSITCMVCREPFKRDWPTRFWNFLLGTDYQAALKKEAPELQNAPKLVEGETVRQVESFPSLKA